MNFWRNGIFMILMMAPIFFIFGCSNKTMSFFFDGVPQLSDSLFLASLDSIQKSDSTDKNETAVNVIKSRFKLHAPYQEKSCNSCHDENSMGLFVEPQPELCYQCHEDFADTYKILHGPVEGGECTSCHSPHMSENEKILLRTGQKLCFYCHDEQDVLSFENHEDIEDTNCIECHNPHGGDDENLLN